MGGPPKLNPPECFVPDDTSPNKGWRPEPQNYPCGPHTPYKAAHCCFASAYCTTEGICKHLGPVLDEYYIGGCTDQTGQDPACPPYSFCGVSSTLNIVYKGDSTWQCCYNHDNSTKGSTIDACRNPSGETFTATPPASLTVTAFVNDDGQVKVYSTSSPAPSSKASSNSSHSSLSTGDKIGAAVGSVGGFIVLFIVGLVVWKKWLRDWLRKRKEERNRRSQRQHSEGVGHEMQSQGGRSTVMSDTSTWVHSQSDVERMETLGADGHDVGSPGGRVQSREDQNEPPVLSQRGYSGADMSRLSAISRDPSMHNRDPPQPTPRSGNITHIKEEHTVYDSSV